MSGRKGQFFPYKDDNPSRSKPYATIALILICVVVFVLSLADFENITSAYGFTPASAALLTIFTSMFLHGGIAHIAGNMWFLWIFGDNVEDKFGKIKYVIFYIASGVAATFVHWLSNHSSSVPAIGASGAISGILGAYIVMFPKVRIHVGGIYGGFRLPAYAMIGFWFLMQLVLGTAGLFGGASSGVAFWAHVGGFVFGAAVVLVAMKLKLVKV